MSEKTFDHVIRERWCKGCNICVALCPKNVLVLQNGKAAAPRPQDCIGCKMCEMRCPDFVLTVHEKNKNSSGT
ncbi:MAG: 4Fe-4S dicluster domain-containing protein [Spirochaetes bacterium]|nr:4Fe-4S dicluster domain-containing protein [Spirochaetota bacterium]